MLVTGGFTWYRSMRVFGAFSHFFARRRFFFVAVLANLTVCLTNHCMRNGETRHKITTARRNQTKRTATKPSEQPLKRTATEANTGPHARTHTTTRNHSAVGEPDASQTHGMHAPSPSMLRGRAEGLDGVSRRFDQRCTHHRLRCERKVLHGLRGMRCVLFLREHYKRLQPRRRPNSCNMQHATYNMQHTFGTMQMYLSCNRK